MSPFVVATLTGRRGRRLRQIRRETRIVDTAGIDELTAVEINGARQWLRIRGVNVANPVLLYLHGGPGGTSLPFRRDIAAWERHFTVVHWEQRGAGKSYSSRIDPRTLTLEQMVLDTEAIIDWVLNRLGQNQLVLLGHSWGSFLAAHVLKKGHPGVAVYVGSGQVGDMVASERMFFEFALEQARVRDDARALADLEAIGAYPTGTRRDHRHRNKVRGWARHFGWSGGKDPVGGRNRAALMATEEYSLRDIYGYLKGTLFVQPLVDVLFDPERQPMTVANEIPVPMVLLSGAKDSFTATPVAEAFFDAVRAPSKQHIVYPEAGHWPMIDEAEAYLDALLTHVRPHVV